MENEKNKSGSATEQNGQSKASYYEGLYQDLPKEVVDILMQTHPLMGREEKAEYHRSRTPVREDVEEVREARMQQVGQELERFPQEPKQEGEPTRYVSRRARAKQEETLKSHTIDQDAYDDGIQYVSRMPAKRKSKIVEEVTIQTMAPAKKKKAKPAEREELPFREERRYEDIDFEAKAKQENLDYLYEDDYDDYEERGGRSKLMIILCVIALVLVIFLAFRCISLSSKVESLNGQLQDTTELSQKYEEEQLKNMQLQEQLDALTNPDSAKQTDGEEGTQSGEGTESTPAGSTSSATETYTTKDGDTYWSIAQDFYGNGIYYTRILEANGLSETDTLHSGMELKIPKE